MESRPFAVLLLALLVAATGASTPRATTGSPTDSTASHDVSVEIDCTEGNVTVVAPPNYEHETTIRFVHVASVHAFVAGGRLAPSIGNRSVGIRRNDTDDAPEDVYAFVRNASADTDAEPVAVARRACDAVHQSVAPDRPRERNDTVVPTVTIDCEAGEVRFEAPDDAEYYQWISSVVVTERRVSIDGSGGSSGWTDENVDTNGSVFVTIYDENPAFGGEQLYTVYERCGPPLGMNQTTVRPSLRSLG